MAALSRMNVETGLASGMCSARSPVSMVCHRGIVGIVPDQPLGNEQTKADLEGRAAAYNPKNYWDIQAWNIQCIVAIAAARLPFSNSKRKREDDEEDDRGVKSEHVDIDKAKAVVSTIPDTKSVSQKPYNPFEGETSAKQLDESLDDFLTRLPPSSTTISTGPWIRIAYPFSPYRLLDTDIPTFKREATDHMETYLSLESALEHQSPPTTPQSTITRKLKPFRDNLSQTILTLAQQHSVKKGKWLLFPSPSHLSRTWSLVASGSLSGTLGCAAKVATYNEHDPRNGQRLLCVYTKDFSDKGDIKRVLRELHRCGLVVDDRNSGREGVIYYKCDAYTHLDIAYGNEFKLKARMYNSRDLFEEMRRDGEL